MLLRQKTGKKVRARMHFLFKYDNTELLITIPVSRSRKAKINLSKSYVLFIDMIPKHSGDIAYVN